MNREYVLKYTIPDRKWEEPVPAGIHERKVEERMTNA